jgi:hypothetical protein
MRTFLAAVLGVIAVGVLLIAYGLLSPRSVTADSYPLARPSFATDRISLDGDLQTASASPVQIRCEPGQRALIRQIGGTAIAECVDEGIASTRTSVVRPVTVADTYSAPRPVAATRVVKTSPNRDWKKTALMIGGSSAAGAGLGGIFGGKKGALIGAAIGGGASTLFEVAKN